MPLTDTAIRLAKATNATTKLSDGGGLQLWIEPRGSKLWRLAYRFGGKQKKLSIGSYPTITLAEARQQRAQVKRLLASGVDPGQQKKLDRLQKASSNASTFSAIAAELLAKKRREGKANVTIGKREWLYGLAGESFGQRPIAEISAAEVLAVLRQVEGRGLIETAHRLRAAIGECFRYAIATGRATNDPTYALRGALQTLKPQHRAAILDANEFGGLLRAIEGLEGQPTTSAALKLMALLFPRPGELRLSEWREFDLENAVWEIPASRTKMRRAHRVPLPPQALAILGILKPFTGHSALVLPGLRTAKRAISENTMNAALRRMGFSQDQMTAHGFRATASTLLNESGKFSVDAIERALAHQDTDEVRRAYARGAFWDERVRMAAWWADYLDALRDGAKVLPFGKRA
jgi:integrase